MQASGSLISSLLLVLLIWKTLVGQLLTIPSLISRSKSLTDSSTLITGTYSKLPKLTLYHLAWILAIPFLASHSNSNSWPFLTLTIGTPTSSCLRFLNLIGRGVYDPSTFYETRFIDVISTV